MFDRRGEHKGKFSFLLHPLVFAVCAALSGCAPTNTSGLNESLEGGFPVHGRFCGPNYPIVKAASPMDEFDKLSSMPSIDKVDEICKTHDLCYVAMYGKDTLGCDIILLRALEQMLDTKTSRRCSALVNMIYSHFLMKNITRVKINTHKDGRRPPGVPEFMDPVQQFFAKLSAGINTALIDMDILLKGAAGAVAQGSKSKKIRDENDFVLPGQYELCTFG